MSNAKKRCRACKKYKPTEDMVNINGGYFCSIDEAAKHANKPSSKAKGKKIKHAAQKKSFQLSDRKIREPAAQKAFNAYIRKRDEKDPCISCGEFRQETALSRGSNWHAGHYKTRGAMPELRFNELNCHKQCAHCNNFLSANLESYRKRLIEKIGADKVDWLEGYHEPKKYTCDELLEVEKHYKQKLKDLL